MAATCIPGACSKHGLTLDADCFRCRTLTVSFAYPYGREQFHSTTLKAEETAIVEGYKARNGGREPEKVGALYSGPVTI